MNLPFTAEQFLDVFKSYNISVWPAQIFLVLLAIFTIFLVLYKTNFSDSIITASLIFYWLWIGIVYHFIFFTKINNAAYVFSVLFVGQALLFFYYGFIKRTLHFNYHNNINRLTAIILFLYALIFYPLLGYHFTHYYPSTPTFGLPCPTTIFTFGILLLLEKPKKIIFLIPFLWSLIGFTAAIKLGIYEDFGLLAAGIITFGIMLYSKNKLE
jgi:hypothetical protein